jgi:aminoglycoside phosphotransferase (APT) family kinase protein
MINPDYSVKEIETCFFTFLKDKVGDFEITEHLSQMKGGNEAYLYRFQVSGIPDMDKPQVLRLFPLFYGEEKAKWEGIIQNLLNQQGILAPRVHLTSSDTTILGGPFLVMDYIEGDTVNPGEDPSILNLAARTQAMLHQIDGKPITEAFIALGQNGSPSIDGRIDWLLGRAEKHPELKDIFQWLVTNKPELPAKLVVVHGDFHPMNMLVKEGEVVAILDWSGFIVGDPMVGLGWTLALFIATAKHTVSKERFDELLG